MVNHKRLFRLYREEQLAVRRRRGRKRAIGARAPMTIPVRPNDRWSLDFVADQLTDGRRFRILAIVDDCTRECLALVADTSLSGIRVARELDRLIVERGKPGMIVSDNGSELTSNAILAWAETVKVECDLSPFFPPLRSRVLGCRHADRDGVSLFGRAPFLHSGHFRRGRRAQSGSSLAAGHRRSRRAAGLTQASTSAA
jgi:Integrase core domain